MVKRDTQKTVAAIKVRQWLRAWDRVPFDAKQRRTKPKPAFYIFTLPAAELRSLCGIFRRETKGVRPRGADLGIQRQHDKDRSDEIWRYVEYGYPWSTLSEAKRSKDEYNDLRKPGWLPTSIVINILESKAQREGQTINEKDVVTIQDVGSSTTLRLPYPKWDGTWKPSSVPPFEVIDGQHRLWAFKGDAL